MTSAQPMLQSKLDNYFTRQAQGTPPSQVVDASAFASAKGSASADDMPLETASQEPDSSCSTRIPVTLRRLAAVVEKHADNYIPEGSPDNYVQEALFKLKDIRDDYLH